MECIDAGVGGTGRDPNAEMSGWCAGFAAAPLCPLHMLLLRPERSMRCRCLEEDDEAACLDEDETAEGTAADAAAAAAAMNAAAHCDASRLSCCCC